jgi:hypothetical protein
VAVTHREADRLYVEYQIYCRSYDRPPLAPVPETDEIRKAREIVRRVKTNSNGYKSARKWLP